MKLIYIGKKNPKNIDILDEKVSFVPNEPAEVKASIGKILLEKAGDIFKSADGGKIGASKVSLSNEEKDAKAKAEAKAKKDAKNKK